MNKLFANIDNGECYLRAVENDFEEKLILTTLPSNQYNIISGEDCFSLVKLSLNLCVDSKLELSTDFLESVIDIALGVDYEKTLEAVRESFYEHDEIIKIIMSETKHSKLASKLVRRSDKLFAINNVKRMGMSHEQMLNDFFMQ